MQVYRDLTLPTTASHCVSANFVSSDQKNLILVRGSKILQIFRFVSHISQVLVGTTIGNGADDYSNTGDSGRRLQENTLTSNAEGDNDFIADIGIEQSIISHQTKLDLIAQYDLNGTVTGISKVRSPAMNPERDYLLISLEDAKLSLICWDDERHSISTVSLHYYEKDKLTSLRFKDEADPKSFLRVDPGNACACLKFEKNLFAFLPFRQDDEEVFSTNKAVASAIDESRTQLFHPSFICNSAELSDDIHTIIDAVFLHEYREPTMAILYESSQTWTGELDNLKDNVTYLVVTFDFYQRSSTSILKIPQLPYDLASMLALPSPIGGILVIGANVLMHIDPSGKRLSVAVNPSVVSTTAIEFVDKSELNYRLEGSRAVYLYGRYVLLTLATGQLLVIEFVMEGRAVESINIHAVSVLLDSEQPMLSLTSSCMEVWASSKTIFVGSEVGNSVLLSWRRDFSKPDEVSLAGNTDENNDSVTIKSKEYDDADIDLYGESYLTEKSQTHIEGDDINNYQSIEDLFKFTVQDTLINHGPIMSVTAGKPEFAISEASRLREVTSKLEIVAARGGQNYNGGLSIFRRSLSPLVIGQFMLPECRALWTVKTKSRNTKTSVDQSIDQFDNYLIVSKDEESLAFKVGEDFEEVKGTEFDLKARTVSGSVLDGTRIVQICTTDIRVYDSDFQIAQMIPLFMEEDHTKSEGIAVAASFSNNAVLVILDNQSALLYIADEETYELAQATPFKSGLVGFDFSCKSFQLLTFCE